MKPEIYSPQQNDSFNLGMFLEHGAIFQWDERHFILSWGEFEKHKLSQKVRPTYYLNDFFMKSTEPWGSFQFNAVYTADQIFQLLPAKNREANKRNWVSPNKALFEKSFQLIQNKIQSAQLKKAVPICFFQSELGFKAEDLCRALGSGLNLPNRYLYGFWNGHQGILGATPEHLFTWNSQTCDLATMALAGTRKSTEAGNLLFDLKERREHAFVVDQISKVFSDAALGELSSCAEIEVGSLTHLKTEMHFRLEKPISFESLVGRLHPTPALGIYSDVLDYHWLEDLPTDVPRKHFGAPFGLELPSGDSRCLVAIRNIQWDGQKVFAGVGCGVVQESQLEREWQELQNKFLAIRESLGL